MNQKDFEKKAKELRGESVTAQARLTELTSPANKLATDPATREKQFTEVQEARVSAKKTSAKYNLFLDKYAKQCAEEEIAELFQSDDDQADSLTDI